MHRFQIRLCHDCFAFEHFEVWFANTLPPLDGVWIQCVRLNLSFFDRPKICFRNFEKPKTFGAQVTWKGKSSSLKQSIDTKVLNLSCLLPELSLRQILTFRRCFHKRGAISRFSPAAPAKNGYVPLPNAMCYPPMKFEQWGLVTGQQVFLYKPVS